MNEDECIHHMTYTVWWLWPAYSTISSETKAQNYYIEVVGDDYQNDDGDDDEYDDIVVGDNEEDGYDG